MSNKYNDEQILYILDCFSSGMVAREIADSFTKEFGVKATTNMVNSLYYRYRFEPIADNVISKNITEKRRQQRSNSMLRKEQKVLLNERVGREDFLLSITKILEKNKVKMHKNIPLDKKKGKIKRALVAHSSDTHIGANIQANELGGMNCFGAVEEARRFALFFKQVAEYKIEYRDETELVLCINGDILQGVIHEQETVEPMTTQFARALNIYSQGISYLAQHFQKVTVVCVAGNHDRYMHKSNKGRQASQKWDNFGTNLFVSLQALFSSYNRVSFNIPTAPYALFDVLGHNVFMTHGDTVINVGNVSKTINISAMSSQINDISIALQKKLAIILVGHVHKSTYQTLDNGTELVINGALSGIDPFAQSIGILHNTPSQQVFEVTKEHAVGDMRFIKLKGADNDKKLDTIIAPLLDIF